MGFKGKSLRLLYLLIYTIWNKSFAISNEISIPELISVLNQFTDCYVHIASDYSLAEIPTISHPFSISDTTRAKLNNIPSRYLNPEPKCRTVVFIFYNGKQEFTKEYDGLFLDTFKKQSKSSWNETLISTSTVYVLLFYINFTF